MAYVAIVTKWHGPTNTKGSRISAQADWGGHKKRLIVDWNHGLGVRDNHRAVAQALAKRHGWAGHWIDGDTEHGCVFVRLDMDHGFLDAAIADNPRCIAFTVKESDNGQV
jgi:hypothetical protein